ncbi:unnamed protein product [Calicophoron daubneyi]|uniref:Uncharacterized protein n=1 Tax=Calicophoron daubneyi TaxID=300641 RepID=A0AAV2T7L4_CALDB
MAVTEMDGGVVLEYKNNPNENFDSDRGTIIPIGHPVPAISPLEYSPKPATTDVEISLLIGGSRSTRQAVTLLKSIFYYFNWKNVEGVNTRSVQSKRLFLHLVVDDLALTSMGPLLDSWDLPRVQYSFYRFTPYEVVNLDVDLISTADIGELWDYFNTFTSHEGFGFNTGVMLLDLAKMRDENWSELWQQTAKENLRNLYYAPLADQDVINAVLAEKPRFVKKLPCEWNLQLNSRAESSRCPVLWDSFHVSSGRRLNSAQPAKLIHCNTPVKPEELALGWSINKRIYDHQNEYQVHPLRAEFTRKYQFFRHLDGQVVRQKMQEGLDNSKEMNVTGQSTSSVLNQSSRDCAEFDLELAIKRRVHPFYLHYDFSLDSNYSYSDKASEQQITLVSQLTFDRLDRLENIARSWEGPISLALYLTDREASLLVEYVEGSQTLCKRRNIGYHVVYIDGLFYPINELRNVGMRFAQTEFVFLLDIDFLPSEGIYGSLQQRVLRHLLQFVPTGTSDQVISIPRPACLVVPAFETFIAQFELPKSKTELEGAWKRGDITQFRHKIWTAGHLATNYTRWLTANETYEVTWSADYEPYVVVSRHAVSFDQRFVGFGWNKASFIMALDALGYQFLVIPEAFIIHMPHPPGIEVFRYRNNPLYK